MIMIESVTETGRERGRDRDGERVRNENKIKF